MESAIGIRNVVRKYLIPILFILVSSAIATMLIISMSYTDAYAVYIDGELSGYVENTDNVNNQIVKIESEIGEIRKENYELSAEVEYEKVTVKNDNLSDPQDIEQQLYDTVDDVEMGYVLKIDDEIIGTGKMDDLFDVLDETVKQYVTDDTYSVEVTTNFKIDYEAIPVETEDNLQNIADKLTSIVNEPVVYTAQEDDTLEKIEEENDLTESELFSLNPALNETTSESDESSLDNEETDIESTDDSIDIESMDIEENTDIIINGEIETEDSIEVDEENTDSDIIEDNPEDIEDASEDEENVEEEVIEETPVDEGTEIILEPAESLFTVITKENTSHFEEIPYETEIVESDDLYIGETIVETEGINGSAMVFETVEFQNGVETDRYETKNLTVDMPTDEIVLIGTKEVEVSKYSYDTEIPIYASNYIWPLANYNSISSGYGWRVLNGSNDYHPAIDIPAPEGTPILASKGGTVIASGWGGDRGWYVQIDHGDGIKTIYQHMCEPSALAVNDTVVQGQIVGFVGSTGYSFGNHLHFEVWVDNGQSWPNNTIDPYKLFTSSSTDTDNVVATLSLSTSSATKTLQNEIVEYAESYLGCPYVHGGHGDQMYMVSDLISYVRSAYGVSIPSSITTSNGVRSYMQSTYGITVPYVFDCSGFTGWVYSHFGYDIPLTVEGQIVLGTSVSVDELQPGDLIFFATTGTGQATHVGMYIGNNQYIHASSTYGQVVTDTVRSTANRPIVDCRRIID